MNLFSPQNMQQTFAISALYNAISKIPEGMIEGTKSYSVEEINKFLPIIEMSYRIQDIEFTDKERDRILGMSTAGLELTALNNVIAHKKSGINKI